MICRCNDQVLSLAIIAAEWKTAREVTAQDVPGVYDIDKIERHFGLRPDAVIARTLEIAVEIVTLAAGNFFDK